MRRNMFTSGIICNHLNFVQQEHINYFGYEYLNFISLIQEGNEDDLK
jgi:hypothetical protein